jgi:hypothetical protein
VPPCTSSTLPPNVTPFKVLKATKPDVSHLRTWGVHCFAHVPVELQTKLGHKSVECLFMGYPPGGRGYRVRSLATNHFFDSGNVIFDENILYHALHEVSSKPVDTPHSLSLPLSTIPCQSFLPTILMPPTTYHPPSLLLPLHTPLPRTPQLCPAFVLSENKLKVAVLMPSPFNQQRTILRSCGLTGKRDGKCNALF